MFFATIVKIAFCERCLQYPEDCECCQSCGGIDEHEHGCDEAETKRSMVVPRKPMRSTLQGIGKDFTYKTPVFVIRVDDDETSGIESTREVSIHRVPVRKVKP